MTRALELWIAGARRAWAMRARLGPIQALRAAALIAPELVVVWAIERWMPEVLLAAALAWLTLEATVGAILDRRATQVLMEERTARPRVADVVRVGIGRTIVPVLVVSAPALVLVLVFGAGPPGRAMVTPVLMATVGSLIAAAAAVLLHLRWAVAHAAGTPAEASRWAKTCAVLAFTTLALVSTMRFGAAWAASAAASVAQGGWAGMVVAIAVVGIATRAIALGTWAEAWRATTVR